MPRFHVFLALLVSLLVLAGCDKEETPATTTDESASAMTEMTAEAEDEGDGDEGEDDGDGEGVAEAAHDDEHEDDHDGEEQDGIDSLGVLGNNLPSNSRGVSHILIRWQGVERAPSTVTRSKEEAEARTNEAMARAAEDWTAAVTEFCEDDATNTHDGELGDLEQGILPGPMDEALFGMEVGDLRGPIETEVGYHVLKRIR